MIITAAMLAKYLETQVSGDTVVTIVETGDARAVSLEYIFEEIAQEPEFSRTESMRRGSADRLIPRLCCIRNTYEVSKTRS